MATGLLALVAARSDIRFWKTVDKEGDLQLFCNRQIEVCGMILPFCRERIESDHKLMTKE
jgi:hypothetical protein